MCEFVQAWPLFVVDLHHLLFRRRRRLWPFCSTSWSGLGQRPNPRKRQFGSLYEILGLVILEIRPLTTCRPANQATHFAWFLQPSWRASPVSRPDLSRQIGGGFKTTARRKELRIIYDSLSVSLALMCLANGTKDNFESPSKQV